MIALLQAADKTYRDFEDESKKDKHHGEVVRNVSNQSRRSTGESEKVIYI